jgi:ribonuclease Z
VVVESEPTVTTARLLLLECTFIGHDVRPEVARSGGHIHLDDLAERASLFQNEAILLTHFSRRHRPEDIRDAVKQRLPRTLAERVHLLLEPLDV